MVLLEDRNTMKLKISILKYFNNTWSAIKEYVYLCYALIYLQEPRYLFPLRFLGFICLIFVHIGNIEIRFRPRKFKDWEKFSLHLESIQLKLIENNEPEWAGYIMNALYVSQSFFERRGELLRVLPALQNEKFVAKLNLKKDIKKAISYLKSFPNY